MNTSNRVDNQENMRAKFSTLWIFIMLNMAFADIFSFMNPGFLKELMAGFAGEIQVNQGFLLVAAIVTEIPIAMVLLSRMLKYRANRRANLIAGVITIAYVIGGGSTSPHYVFFATMEVISAVLILWFSWKWPNPESHANTMALRQAELGGHS